MGTTQIADYSVIADPHFYARHGVPFDVFDALRRMPGLTRIQPKRAGEVWAVTRYDDIRHVGRQQEMFRNAPRLVIETDPSSATSIPGFENLLDMDPPKHGLYRKILAGQFTVNAVMARSQIVERYADRAFATLLDQARASESFDLVKHVAYIVPTFTTCALIGIPEEFAQQVTDWVHQISAATDEGVAIDSRSERRVGLFRDQIAPFFLDLLNIRRKKPEDDLISALAQSTEPKLLDTEILAFCILLMAGGDDTTREAFCGGMLALAQHPAEMRRLQRNPELLTPAIEEILRWTSPITHFCRTASQDCEVAGTRIAKDDCLALFYPSGNRDERRFSDPYSFRIDRQPNPHITFGFGGHTCLGSNLARLELRRQLERILPHIRSMEFRAIERAHENIVVGWKRLECSIQLR